MKKKLIVLLFYNFFLISCVPQMIKNEFTYCYNVYNTGLDSLININGYYSITNIWERNERYTTKGEWKHKVDTLYTNIIFFSDGIFANTFCNFYDNNNNNNNNNISQYFQQIDKNKKEGAKDSIMLAYFWGCYTICGDTIKTQYINHPDPLAPTWMAFETWYKIIDKNTIKAIAFRKLYYDKENEAKSKPEMNLRILDEKDTYIASFAPVNFLPSSYCWLKEKKWFWCDKQAWKMYKKTRKK